MQARSRFPAIVLPFETSKDTANYPLIVNFHDNFFHIDQHMEIFFLEGGRTLKGGWEIMRFITRVHIDGAVWYLDVDSSNPGAGAGPKGLAVRQLKWYVSWVCPIL